jgi:peptide chain release factor 1
LDVRQKSNNDINLNDCQIEWFSGSGAGGQHRNKHQNCCRIRHVPSGLVESSQCRTRTQSYSEAFAALQLRVCLYNNRRELKISTLDRKQQVGSGQRGDKIRTIQFQNDTVVDHITGLRMSAAKYMKGWIHELWRNK